MLQLRFQVWLYGAYLVVIDRVCYEDNDHNDYNDAEDEDSDVQVPGSLAIAVCTIYVTQNFAVSCLVEKRTRSK